MTRPFTLAIVGAGSSYTPELLEGLVASDPAVLPVVSLRLTDVNADRLEIMARLAGRMAAARGRDLRITHDTRLEPMLEGADFVVTQIRIGGMKARRIDETVPPKYGIIGQETTGPGGMFKALRTIPPMLEIGRTVARVAPAATILNYTNPSGIVTEAVSKHSGARILGLCSGIPSVQDHVHRRLREDFPALKSYSVGLNHLGFLHRFTNDGADVTANALARFCARERAENPDADAAWLDLIEAFGAIPMWGYSSLFFHRERKLAEQRKQERPRSDAVAELEERVFAEAADPSCAGKPPSLAARGGGGYSEITFAVLGAILGDRGDELVMSTPNGGAVLGVPDDASVEITCRVDRHGATPVAVGPLPAAFRGIVQAVKAYESLTVEAAVTGSRRLAVQALLNHPLCQDIDLARPLVDEMAAAHGIALR